MKTNKSHAHKCLYCFHNVINISPIGKLLHNLHRLLLLYKFECTGRIFCNCEHVGYIVKVGFINMSAYSSIAQIL
jgi:hypothetical protein